MAPRIARSASVTLALLVLAAGSLPAAATPFTYRVCGHMPITGAAPIPHHESRFGQFYFDYVNAELGGIDGHPVVFRTHDDRYFAAGARDAAEKCRRDGVHLMVGAVGIDQIISVARWAGMTGIPYLHGQVPRGFIDELPNVAALYAPDDDLLTGLARSMVEDPAGQRFGYVMADSAFADAGFDAFNAALEALGAEPAVPVRVQKDEQQYANAWRMLQDEDVTDVVVQLPAIQIIRFTSQRPFIYDPMLASTEPSAGTRIVAASGTLRRMSVLHQLGPVYDPEDRSLPWYREMQTFLRIFRDYSPEQDPPPDEWDWESYLRAKAIHHLLDDLDEDLSPAAFREAFAAARQGERRAWPTCGFDFGIEPRIGAHAWHAFSLDGAAWRQSGFCVDDQGSDLHPPVIDCPSLLSIGSARCTGADRGAGIASIEARGADGRVLARTRGGCAGQAALTVEPALGLHDVTVTARDCSGLVGADRLYVLGTG